MIKLKKTDFDFLDKLKMERELSKKRPASVLTDEDRAFLDRSKQEIQPAVPAQDMWQVSHPSQQIIPERQGVVEQLKTIAKPPLQ